MTNEKGAVGELTLSVLRYSLRLDGFFSANQLTATVASVLYRYQNLFSTTLQVSIQMTQHNTTQHNTR
jgi:hypothetical protein